MNLSENNESFFIDNIPLGFSVIAGFSKPVIGGTEVNSGVNRIFSKRGIKNLGISCLNQVHGSFIYETNEAGIYTADGLITSIRNLVIVVKTADCLPLFIIDNRNNKIGVIHMGWRSAKAGILDSVPVDFKYSYVIAGVGLRKCCYEVGENFLSIEKLSPFIQKRSRKFYLDIISFVKMTLLQRGLKESNFYDLGMCSFCSKNRFFSHRRTKTKKRTLSFSVIIQP